MGLVESDVDVTPSPEEVSERSGSRGWAAAWRLLRPNTTTTGLPPEGRRPVSSVFWRRDAINRRALAGADMLAAALALYLAAAVIMGHELSAAGLLALPLIVLTAKLMGLYDRDELVFHKATLDEAPKLFHLATLYALLASFAQAELVPGGLSTGALIALWLSFLLAAVAGRSVARRLTYRLVAPERCLIIGRPAARLRLADKLAASRRANAEVVGFLPLDQRRAGNGATVAGEGGQASLRDLPALVDELDVHRVVVIPGSADTERMLEAISRAKAVGVKVSILPRLFEVVGSSVEFDELDGTTVLGVRRFGLSRSSFLIKRSMDVVCSALGLVLLTPVAAAIAIAVKLDSRGPVFFRQARVGRGGRPFTMLKFRSMLDGAEDQKAGLSDRNEAEGLFKIADDPRVTRVGGFLRRHSLDELPQLVNVLRGEMSLVGPRPLVAEDDERVEGRHRTRLALTPGMTGPWQVLGSSRIPLSEMVNIDYLYGANWSLWTDVKLLLRTAPHVLGHRGQ